MKIGFAQVDIIRGDFKGNKEKIIDAYRYLCAQKADIVLFPELAIPGYGCADLYLNPHFIRENEATLQSIVPEIGTAAALIGYVQMDAASGKRYNAAAFCANGTIVATAQKCLLPNYDVFNEERYFTPGKRPVFVEWKGTRIGLSICEDIWGGQYLQTNRADGLDPIQLFSEEKPELILNISASPWDLGKAPVRVAVLQQCARVCQCPVAYCNLVGGNDEIIFDGHSCLVMPEGALYEGVGFKETYFVQDPQKPNPNTSQTPGTPMEDLRAALVLGIRDYFVKTNFKKAVIGLSGGVDSALVAALAVQAIGAGKVHGLILPSRYSSSHSKADAHALAKNLNIEATELSIEPCFQSAIETMLPLLETGPFMELALENLQARIRGMLIMALANSSGALMLTTSNKSEMAVGYGTLYGDLAGGLSVIGDLLKTQVYALAHYMNDQGAGIPKSTLEKAPSAELRPGQTDEDSLPAYAILDGILTLHLEKQYSREALIAAGYPAEIVDEVLKKIYRNEYKRKQAPIILKVSPLAFGIGRRMPVAHLFTG